jgi:hypothetical protein
VLHFRVIRKAANCAMNDSSSVLMYLFIIWKILDPVFTKLALFDRVHLLRMICDGSRIYSTLLHLCYGCRIYSALLHLCRGCNRTLLHSCKESTVYKIFLNFCSLTRAQTKICRVALLYLYHIYLFKYLLLKLYCNSSSGKRCVVLL